MTTECSICCDTFNRSVHQKVTCSFCDHLCCRKCVQTYLLNTSNDPHCMQCKNVWNREFVDRSCSKSFRHTELKTHRENILFEREKCLLPETQIFVVRKKKTNEIQQLIKGIDEQIGDLNRTRYDLERQKLALEQGIGIDAAATEKKTFVRKCPVEDCRGFLSTQWKCEVCDNKICKDCNEIKEDEHTCDPANVETVALIKKDTKPCPSCGTLIFKISGCSQMWCPSCHCAFNWNTGRLETGIIHNPHYYEFQRTNGSARGGGRNLGDIPCGGLPTNYEMNSKFNPTYYNNRPQEARQIVEPERSLQLFHRLTGHILEYELRYNYRNTDTPPDNRQLRVQYLMNEISEDQLKSTIQKREKAFEKRRDIANILRMFGDTSSDLLRQFINEDTPVKDTLDNLAMYCNKCFTSIHKRYNCVTPFIKMRQIELFSNNYK